MARQRLRKSATALPRTFRSRALVSTVVLTFLVLSLSDCSLKGSSSAEATVYAATNGGLSISRNGGSSWTNYTTADGLAVNAINAVCAVGPNIYAGTNGGGLSVSTDGAAHWTTYTTADGLCGNQILDVCAVDSSVYAVGYGGLSVSTDLGRHWTAYSTAQGLASDSAFGVCVVGSDPSTATIYVSTGAGLSISTNGGTTWATNGGLGAVTLRRVQVVGSTIYAPVAASGLYVSNDGGSTWPGIHLNPSSIASVWAVGAKVYAAVEAVYYWSPPTGALFFSTDSGSTWPYQPYFKGDILYVFALGSNIYASVHDSANQGMMISADWGSTWTKYTTANGLGDNQINCIFAQQ